MRALTSDSGFKEPSTIVILARSEQVSEAARRLILPGMEIKADVIDAKVIDDRFPIYALRPPLQWSDDASSMEYVSPVPAVMVATIADWGEAEAANVSAMATKLKKACFKQIL